MGNLQIDSGKLVLARQSVLNVTSAIQGGCVFHTGTKIPMPSEPLHTDRDQEAYIRQHLASGSALASGVGFGEL